MRLVVALRGRCTLQISLQATSPLLVPPHRPDAILGACATEHLRLTCCASQLRSRAHEHRSPLRHIFTVSRTRRSFCRPLLLLSSINPSHRCRQSDLGSSRSRADERATRREAVFQAANEADPRIEQLDESQLRQALADERRLRKEVFSLRLLCSEELMRAYTVFRNSISIKLA